MNRVFHLSIILRLYALILSIFTFFRILLFSLNTDRLSTTSFLSIFKAFLMGLRFDLVICSYFLFLPFLLLSISFIIKKHPKTLILGIQYFCFVLFSVSFFISAADIPYFNQFFKRLDASIFSWLNDPSFVIEMIFSEIRYWGMFIPFLLVSILFYKALGRIFNGVNNSPLKRNRYFLGIFLSLFFLALMVLGMRGRLAKKSPIRVGTAYFSDDQFLNKLGLNPNFTLIRGYLNQRKSKELNLMDVAQAKSEVQKSLNIKSAINMNPIARFIQADSISRNKANVVLILMESMSANLLHHYGNSENLTPFLDSLITVSYNFTNTYSAGIHTFNGLFSTLFSFPAIYAKHPMKSVEIKQFNSMAYSLKQHGYTNVYFTTHDGQYDNIQGFLKANYFDQIYTEENYPSEKVLSNLGVPDDYLFEYAMPVLEQLSNEEKRFFATFLTASNHGPYRIPHYFKPRSKEIKKQVVEYADWSLRKFLTLAKRETWYKNTIFVFLADHGLSMNEVYSTPLSYNHIPLIIHSPLFSHSPVSNNHLAQQIDVFPTLMGLLNLPYLNTTLGIDLLHDPARPFTYFCSDNQLSILNEEFLLILNGKQEALYRYRSKDRTNYLEEEKTLVQKMKLYAQSQIQLSDYIIKNNLQFISHTD